MKNIGENNQENLGEGIYWNRDSSKVATFISNDVVTLNGPGELSHTTTNKEITSAEKDDIDKGFSCTSSINFANKFSTSGTSSLINGQIENAKIISFALSPIASQVEMNFSPDTNTTAIDLATTDSKCEEIPAIALSSTIEKFESDSCVSRQPAGKVIDDARRLQIFQNIQHRRKLLSWVKESRKVCENNAIELSSGLKKNFIAEIVGNGFKPAGTKTEPYPSENNFTTEIEDFQKIITIAGISSILKRPKPHESSLDIFPKRDLRKGSNTYKRMSKTIFTLNNDMETVTKSDSSNLQQNRGHQGPHTTVFSTDKVTILNNSSAIQSPHESTTTTHEQTSMERNFEVERSIHNLSRILKKEKTRKTLGLKNNDGSITIPLRSSSRNQSIKLSKHASTLIDRRESMTLKLNDMLRKHDVFFGLSAARPLALPTNDLSYSTDESHRMIAYDKSNQCSTINIGNKSKALSKFLSLSDLCRPVVPPRMPPRKKTQWDCVLEEMRCIASDFIEERKWKLAWGKAFSSSVQKYHSDRKVTMKFRSKLISFGVKDIISNGGDKSVVETLQENGTSLSSTESNCEIMSPRKTSKLIADTDSDTTDQIYIDITAEDNKSTIEISRLLSVAVLEGLETTNTERTHQILDDRFEWSCRRFEKMRRCCSIYDSLVFSKTFPKVGDNTDSRILASGLKKPAYSSGMSFSDISEQVENSIELVKLLKEHTISALMKERVKQKYRNSFKCGVDLNPEQLCAVYFLESLWQSITKGFRNKAGKMLPSIVSAILGGSFGNGKTVAACALLWKNRKSGPQLIICSPRSLIRWKEELNRFNDLQVNVVGYRGWSFDANNCDTFSIDGPSLLVCDYLSFLEVVGPYLLKNENTPFDSMVLDLRPSSSSLKETPESQSIGLESIKWWNFLNKFILKFSLLKRLLIEHIYSIDSAVETKHREKLLSMKVAFAHHPSTFSSRNVSVGKRVLSWAKCQRGSNGSTLDPSLKVEDRIESVLKRSLSHITFYAESEEAEEESVVNGVPWEVRFCTLTEAQKLAYNRCRFDVKRSIFKTFKKNCQVTNACEHFDEDDATLYNCGEDDATLYNCGKDEAIVRSLPILRNICLHSNLCELTKHLQSPLKKLWKEECVGSRILKKSTTPSEPNLEVLRKLVEKSSKMKELLSVLIEECDITLANKEGVTEILKINRKPQELDSFIENKRTKKSKVLILATLVEAQLLISIFLTSVGFHHEVLVSRTTAFKDPILFQNERRCLSSNNKFDLNPSAWAWSQRVITQFNRVEDSEGIIFRTYGIIISSPVMISSLTGGICPSSADLVISLDEDWSGHEALHIFSIFRKIRYKKQSLALTSSCKFLKIICKNTCEEALLCGSNGTLLHPESNKMKGEVHGLKNFGIMPRHKFLCMLNNIIDEKRTNTNNILLAPTNHLLGSNMARKNTTELLQNSFTQDENYDRLILDLRQFFMRDVVVNHRKHKQSTLTTCDKRNYLQKRNFDIYEDIDFFRWLLLIEGQNGFCSGHASSAPNFQDFYMNKTRIQFVPHISLSLSISSIKNVRPDLITSLLETSALPVHSYVESLHRLSQVPSGTSSFDGILQNTGSSTNCGTMSSTDLSIDNDLYCPNDNFIDIPLRCIPSSLLVYGTQMMMPISWIQRERLNFCKKRKLSQFESLNGHMQGLTEVYPQEKQHRCPPSFDSNKSGSICVFSLYRQAIYHNVRERDQNFEPLVYIPSFLSTLVHIENFTAHSKRKTYDSISSSDSKRLKISMPVVRQTSQLMSSCMSLTEEKVSHSLSLEPHLNPCLNNHFSAETSITEEIEVGGCVMLHSNIETNSYSTRKPLQHDDKFGFEFTNSLQALEVHGAISSQPWPALNRFILLTHKRCKKGKKSNTSIKMRSLASSTTIFSNIQFDTSSTNVPGFDSESVQEIVNHQDQKTLSKRIKKHHLFNTVTSAREKYAQPSIKREYLLERSYGLKEGLKHSTAASILGSVRLRFRLNCAVYEPRIATNTLSLHPDSKNQTLYPHEMHFGPYQFGEKTKQTVERLVQRGRNRTGIALPMGVKRPRLSKKFSNSLKETLEPWSDVQDKLLKESVARYGTNWQLASRLVSSSGLFLPLSISGQTFLFTSRRSPSQCQYRWETLTTSGDTSKISDLLMSDSNDHSSNKQTTVVIKYNHLPHLCDKLKPPKTQLNDSSHWINTSISTLKSSTPVTITYDLRHLCDPQLKQLIKACKKQCSIPIIIPGSNTVGNETVTHLVPVHTSHSDSIQAARGSWPPSNIGNSSIRSEMWPLEFLDYLSKSKNMSVNPTSSSAVKSASKNDDTRRVQHNPSLQSPKQMNAKSYQQPHNNLNSLVHTNNPSTQAIVHMQGTPVTQNQQDMSGQHHLPHILGIYQTQHRVPQYPHRKSSSR